MAKVVWTEKASIHLQAIYESLRSQQAVVPILAVIHAARDFSQVFVSEWEVW